MAAARKRFKPQGRVLCTGCSKLVEAVCYGLCPKCFRKREELIEKDLRSKDPQFKGFQDEKFHLNMQIEGLNADLKSYEKTLRRILVMKGPKKKLAEAIVKLIVRMGGRG